MTGVYYQTENGTHARTFATFAYARAFTPILQCPQAHPRYSLVLILYVVYIRMRVRERDW